MKDDYSLEWMMWQISDAQAGAPPLDNIIKAIEYYASKYGKVPNRCEVPSQWGDNLKAPDGLHIRASSNLSPRHLRLTVDPAMNGARAFPFKPKPPKP